jgi:Holliday junction resolvase
MLYINHLGGFCSEIDNKGFWNKSLNRFVPSKTRNGIPDVIACIGGRFIGIEVKAGNDTMRQAQYEVCIEIEQAKGRYFIAKNFQSFFEWIQVLKGGSKDGK